MKIIIEGPDGAGKSTLASLLSGYFGYPVQHRDKPKTEEDRIRMFESYIESAKDKSNMIYDRFAYSEMVYGSVMRDKNYINVQQMYEIELELKKNGGIIIFCDNCITKLWEACLDRGETYIKTIDQLVDIQNMYQSLFMDISHMIPIFHYKR